MSSRRLNLRKASTILIPSFFILALVFQNFSPASDVEKSDLYDYLVMNVCVDTTDHILPLDPFHCGANKSRNLRAGESLPYFAGDFAPVSSTNICAKDLGLARSFAVPLGLEGTDQVGTGTPLVGVWENNAARAYDPSGKDCNVAAPTQYDNLAMVAIFGGYAHMVGGYQNSWTVSLGEGFTNMKTRGLGRFDNAAAIPDGLPAGTSRASALYRRNFEIGDSEQTLAAFPPHLPDSAPMKLTPQRAVSFAKQTAFNFGPGALYPQASSLSHKLETIVSLNFSKSNDLGDAPSVDTGTSEHLYVTHEIGYASRREEWRASDRDPSATSRAADAYDNQSCSAPADLKGELSPHFSLAAVQDVVVQVDGRDRHAYSQDSISIDPQSGKVSTRTWYLTGCRDFTNVHPLALPMDVKSVLAKDPVTREAFNPMFLSLFGVD